MHVPFEGMHGVFFFSLGDNVGKWTHRVSDVVPETSEAICSKCGRVKVRMKCGRWRCRVALKEQRGKNTKEAKKRYYNAHREEALKYRKAYRKAHPNKNGTGFTHLRGDHCEICNTKNNLCGDHDHITGKFRGTLCRSCNFGLGFFKDNKALLAEAILYLSR
jgi:Recombination endonuclease VII